MALTGWRRIDSFFSGEVQAREEATFSRTNNTLHVSGFRSQWRVTVSGNDNSISTQSYMSSGTNRKTTNFGSKSWSANQVFYGDKWSGNIGVGANDSSISTRTRWADHSGAWYNSTANFSIPTLGSPTGLSVSTSLVTKSTARLHSNVSSWGTNATAGDGARLEYKKSSSGTWTNLAYNDPGTHYRDVSGLTPNTKYDLRNYARNGGGKSSGSSIINFYTLSEVFEAGTIDIQAVSYSVTGAKARPGHYTNYSKIQYRKKGSSTWLNSAEKSSDTFSITITGLLPSTTYERRFVCRTSAGTTENSIIEFTTLPAAKLVMPNGTVKNAIPRVVHPNGTVKMVKVKHL